MSDNRIKIRTDESDWTEEQRSDERAFAEERRRAAAAHMTPEAWENL